ncbi:IclR family transcriptional regulator [Burkholderia sp. Bp9004]|uniref:IclR family transcriptional regulator n=1 Tax=Burkholderia sp. Bp9004 TaxID=2184559 RepID=UPI000F60447B|nr:IclR family transcriptional regulator [Burkholderia sp. Bp9004]RQZ62261.1 IclR family transcriptional regulator [Burkholderia sp. Bp9004]
MASGVTSHEPGYSGLLDRGLAILELLAGSETGASLTSISEQLRIPRSATHRLLTALSDHGYVRQEQDRGVYVLTTKLQVLAFRHLASSGYVDAAQQVLDRLAMATGELVRLAVADNDQLTWVAKSQGARSGLRYDPDMGMIAKLSCSATGYAWLSKMNDDEAIKIIESQGYGSRDEYGPRAPETAAEVLAHIHDAREQGYAIAVQTFTDWMAAIATALIHPLTKKPIGVVSVAGPFSRLPEKRLHEFAPLLIEAAREIAQLIPGSPALTSPGIAALAARESAIS